MVDTWAVPGYSVPVSQYNPFPVGNEVQFGNNIFSSGFDLFNQLTNRTAAPSASSGAAGAAPFTLPNVDVTAPGITQTDSSSSLARQVEPYEPAILDAARNIYNQGAPGLNPLQQAAINQTSPIAAQQSALANQGAGVIGGILSGQSPILDRVGAQASVNPNLAASRAGTLGGTRANYARDKAVSDALLDTQLAAQGRIGTAQADLQRPIALQQQVGQEYQDFQQNQPWDWLGNYQRSIGFGQHSPQLSNQVRHPSGADIYASQLSGLRAGGVPYGTTTATSGGSGGSSFNPLSLVSGVLGGGSNPLSSVFGGGNPIGSILGGFFAEGGEVHRSHPSSRYSKAKMRKNRRVR